MIYNTKILLWKVVWFLVNFTDIMKVLWFNSPLFLAYEQWSDGWGRPIIRDTSGNCDNINTFYGNYIGGSMEAEQRWYTQMNKVNRTGGVDLYAGDFRGYKYFPENIPDDMTFEFTRTRPLDEDDDNNTVVLTGDKVREMRNVVFCPELGDFDYGRISTSFKVYKLDETVEAKNTEYGTVPGEYKVEAYNAGYYLSRVEFNGNSPTKPLPPSRRQMY